MNSTKLVNKLNAQHRNIWLVKEFAPVLLAIVGIVIVAFIEFAYRNV